MDEGDQVPIKKKMAPCGFMESTSDASYSIGGRRPGGATTQVAEAGENGELGTQHLEFDTFTIVGGCSHRSQYCSVKMKHGSSQTV